jgi:hypothetical protein
MYVYCAFFISVRFKDQPPEDGERRAPKHVGEMYKR